MFLKSFMSAAVFSSGLVLAALPAAAENPRELIRQAGVEQRLGETVPLDLAFTDAQGRQVRLGDYFGNNPVIITPVYYECPMLCTLILNGLVKTLKVMEFAPGKEFEIVTFSFDPAEGTELARKKKELYVHNLGKEGAADGWHFLTGSPESVQALTQALGFRAAYDSNRKEYAHAASIMVLTPEGKISHYFYGIDFSARDLRLALVEAARKKIGTVVDQFLLLCYHYDPSTGKYGFAVMNALKIGGFITVAALFGFIWGALRKERTDHKAGAA